jgi:GNAT superfamily N-acetyltransferase
MIEIRKIRLHEIETDTALPALCKEYENEARIEGMPLINVQNHIYHQIESTGSFVLFGAYHDGKLIGFLSILVTLAPHYGTLSAMGESFFVGKLYRKTGAGLKLLAAAEKFSEQIGAPGFLCSARVESVLSKVLPRRGYKETNRVFFKSFSK